MGSVMNISLSCNIVRVIILLSLFASFANSSKEENILEGLFFQ